MTRNAFILSIATTALVFTVAGYCSAPDPALAPLQQGVTAAKAVRAAVVETVTVYVPRAVAAKARSDSADALVEIQDDTLLSVRLTPVGAPTLVIVPPQVTKDLTQLRQTVAVQDTTIRVLRSALSADSAVIRRQDSLVAALRPARCGWRCGATIGGVLGLLAAAASR